MSPQLSLSLAPEIWFLIADSLSSRHLSHLCRTSRYFLQLFRPVIYQVVNLKYRRNFEETIKLLASDRALAKHVLHMTFPPPHPVNHGLQELIPLFYVAAVQNMTSLKKLKLGGAIFNGTNDQALFVETISGLETPLDEFNLTSYSLHAKLPGNTLAISKLTSLTWVIENPELLTPMWTAIEASRDTLKHLKLYFEAPKDEFCKLPLWAMLLPCLKSLSLTIRSYQLDGASPTLAEFVIAHGSTLEELEIASEEENEFAVGFEDSETLKSDSLPHLRSFKGRANCFQEMVAARMSCLATLQVLQLVPRKNDDNLWAMEMLYDVLEELLGKNETTPILQTLKELGLRINDAEWYSTADFLDAIHSFARVCGKTLEVWLGDYSVMRGKESLTTALTLFPRLRVAHLDLSPRRLNYKDVAQDWALDLAKSSPALEQVVIHLSDLGGSYIAGSVRITRDGKVPGVFFTEALHRV